MVQTLTTTAVWLNSSYVEHATGETVHLAPQYLEAAQYRALKQQLMQRGYTLIPLPGGGLRALAPKSVSRSEVTTLLTRPVDPKQPFTPAQQFAYEQHDNLDVAKLIGTAD